MSAPASASTSTGEEPPPPPILTPQSSIEDSPVGATRTSRGTLGGDAVELRRLHHSVDDPAHFDEKGGIGGGGGVSESGSDSEDGYEKDTRPTRRIRRVGMLSQEYTDEEEKTVLRKLDRKLVIFLGFLYMLSNARIAGLEKDLSLSSAQYDWLLTAFYITYIAFEWMILLYRHVPAHVYIALCVLSWGVVASLQSLTTSFGQLLLLRGLLGITEAAFGPGVPFFMTHFFKRSELAYRVGLQIAAAPLATSFASSLAYLIVLLSQKGPLAPWRALFLVEGFPSVLAAVAAWYYIPDSPGKARYLTPRERKVAVLRLRSEQQMSLSTHSDDDDDAEYGAATWSQRLKLNEIRSTVLDPKSYLSALMFLSVNVSFSSLPVFLPTIINSMSFSPLASQALAAPPYLFAFFFVLVVGRYSDKVADSRSLFLIGVALLSAFSYAGIAVAGYLHESLGEAGSITIRYVAIFGAAMGLFSSVTLIITWTLNNQATATGKGTGLTILNVVGQCGPLIGVHVFPESQGPLYVQGMAVCAGFMAFGVAGLALVLRMVLNNANRRRGLVGPIEAGDYELAEAVEPKPDRNDDSDVEDTLIGGAKKVVGEKAAFRYML
ncbi:hypothetical protein PV08_09074 [Exophiala spinifera]|uniref:Major facilitator superfamily (MFS) profile domain-containing protein n=1 Tax=Exophiala spinifera TaxID=91928 RepID=A0A0D1ZFM4_9EURO|nr:uncharacterized protein PV08_09074 [Exophiala spinifera]KIW11802.1 hypothetical protein PV08_09074 [Exophiala spinifera]